MKTLLLISTLTLGLALPASAAITIVAPVADTYGNNDFDGVDTAVDPDSGAFLPGLSYYTGSGLSVSTDGYFIFSFVGQESGYANGFHAMDASGGTADYVEFGNHASPTNLVSEGGIAFGSPIHVSAGMIDPSAFYFTSNEGHGGTTVFNMSSAGFGYFTNGGTGGLTEIYFALDDTGTGADNDHDDMVILARFISGIPEPTTWLLIVLGFGFAAIATNRRNKRGLTHN